MALGCRDGSVNEAKPALDPWNSHDGRTELTPTSCPLTFLPHIVAQACMHLSIYTNKKRSNENSKYINNSA